MVKMRNGLMSTMGFQEFAIIIERHLVLYNCGMAHEDLHMRHAGDDTLQDFDMIIEDVST